MKKLLARMLIMSFFMTQSYSIIADENTINILMESYQSQGIISGNAQRGEQFWNKKFTGKAPFTERSCNLCHTENLTNKGKHARTGKILEPLAPSVNKNSFSNIKKIKKWFKRNCKWTTGTECSTQTKADILAFIKQQ